MNQPCRRLTLSVPRQSSFTRLGRYPRYQSTSKTPHPRAGDIGRNIEDEYALIRDNYRTSGVLLAIKAETKLEVQHAYLTSLQTSSQTHVLTQQYRDA